MIAAEILLGLIIFIFGSCIFSFLNVLIYRIPRNEGVVRGYSHCTSCGHRLYGRDMLPVLSWLFLKGKCRYCGSPVSGRYALVELMGGVAALVCVRFYGCTLAGVTAFAFFCLLTVIAFIDYDTMEIPNRLNVAMAVLGVISWATMPEISILQRLIGALAVSLTMIAVDFVVPGGFGGGDIKLVAAAGLLLGWKNNLLAALLGIFFGGIYGMWLLVRKKAGRKDHFAFGPFLCAGMAIALSAGEQIIHWYLGFFPSF